MPGQGLHVALVFDIREGDDLMKSSRQKALQQVVALSMMMTAFSWNSVEALPEGGTVRSGDADISKQDQTLVIDQHTQTVALDWNTFDIAKGETVRFNQQASDIALNRIIGNKASEIYGNLQADGTVLLLNPHGVLFGQGAQVDVGNLVASTAQVDDSFMTGFGGSVEAISLKLGEASDGKIINAGDIRAQGGLVALHASVVENTGSIASEGGKIALSAAKNLNISIDLAKKLNFETTGELATAHVLNTGSIQANGGHVLMTAKSAGDMLSEVVNNEGIIEAKTASINDKGEILLDGGEHGTVNVGGTLDASGLAEGQSGGIVRIVGENTSVKANAKLIASGDKDGGLVETSGDVLDVSTKADIEAQGRTGKAGEWLLDPIDIIISNEAPVGYTALSDTAGTFVSQSTTNEEKHSYINSDSISLLLSKGTNVTIQAIDGHTTSATLYDLGTSNITVNAPITKYKIGDSSNDATLTLEAQRNVSINKPITSTDGKLNVNLHADHDGDAKGMVILNADINTNGGNFTSGTGKNINEGTVGTYVGHADGEDENIDRQIITNGGNANLYGDVALGLNQGDLRIDTRNTAGTGGAIKITGNVDSANTYKLFINNTDSGTKVRNNPEMKSIAKYYYDEHLKDIVFMDFDAFADLAQTDEHYAKLYQEVAERCFNQYGGYQNRVEPTTPAERKEVLKAYFNEHVSLGTVGDAKDFDALTSAEYEKLAKHILTTWAFNKTNNRESILNRWEAAKEAAKEGTAGGAAIGDKYLATITTAVEDWVVSSLMAGREYELLIGGRTDYVGYKVTAGRVFRWETGPEGLANNGAGTVFFTATGAGNGYTAENMYQGWSHDVTNPSNKFNEPNNDGKYEQPYVAVGWRCDTSWADVDNQKNNVKGFIQETNSEHSGLNLQGGTGNVTIGGNIGKSATLQELTINTAGKVEIGGGTNLASGGTFTGQVFTDNGVDITGGAGGITVGDRITSAASGVTLTSQGDITTNGITASDKVALLTTENGKTVTMNGNIQTSATAVDAVIIDAKDGTFINNSVEAKGIETGTGGSWKIYSNAPADNTFGTNLNSGTYALWNRGSESYGYTAVQADDASAVGRYIFRHQPVVTFTANDQEKIYGNEAQSQATWTVTSDSMNYSAAFDESTVVNETSVAGNASSAGFAATATRTDGQYSAADSNMAIYDINMGSDSPAFQQTKAYDHGYNPVPAYTFGKINVNRRDLTVALELSTTYGSTDYTQMILADNLVNGDSISQVSYTLDDSYAALIGASAVTAPVGEYANAVLATLLLFEDTNDAANYNVTYNNAKLTITPKEVLLDLTGSGTSLDKENIQVQGASYASQLVNGDTLDSAPAVAYDIGGQLSGNTYGIDLLVNGNKVTDGTTVDNYRFKYTGVYTLEPISPPEETPTGTLEPISPTEGTPTDTSEPIGSTEGTPAGTLERPQFAALSLTPRAGEGSYQLVTDTKTTSVQQVLGLTTAKLPFVKKVGGSLISYGTYKLSVDPERVTLEAADTSIPVPENGRHDQYREYTRTITTERGGAEFKLSYDGSVFALHPADKQAEMMLKAGDAVHNVDIVSKALHIAFSEMGLGLEDLDAVYVCFD